MIVVDTNIISYFYLTSEFSELAAELYQKNPNWIAPLLWRSEFRNVLSFYIRRNILSLSDAIEIFETAEILLRNSEFEINSAQVLKLSQLSGCSANDCEFVNLAQDLNTTLVTMDRKILKIFSETALSIQNYIEKS